MFGELLTLQGLGLVVTLHLICWAVLDLYITLLDLIGNKEIPDLNMPGALAHTFVAIFLQLDGAFVVLQDYVCLGLVSLCLQEIPGP